ncbi:MAG: group II intron reverse transcriptase/maturase [Synechococcaceae cyanobacterium RM1_1_27]|nr:group II intron reverse transcriptase/maturase [Synechococcaceae cyanobacterium SM2_3_2]NJO85928.1 group II intron reverse transcriptase/maturase [Synechococcaceae cyanobacterium RM1_1_27]
MNTAKPMYRWEEIRWKSVQQRVFKLQKRIYRASQRGDGQAVRLLQKLLVDSFAAKLLAVRKVAQENQGKNTPGVDGFSRLRNHQKLRLAQELRLSDKSKPTKRVWIPKPGRQEKRPLGIPTMEERARQALAKLALEPEWEAKFEPNSYGFRPGRSAHDAIAALFNAVNQREKYVLDADIEKCFDRIDHQKLLDKVNTYPTMRRQLRAWLKAEVMDGRQLLPTHAGTPQGGVISPLLANIALHETHLKKKFTTRFKGRNQTLSVVRYADDFVILHESKGIIQMAKEETEQWLNEIGLQLKESKTRLCHTLISDGCQNAGFDFLGFNIIQRGMNPKHTGGYPGTDRKRGFKTFITPSKEAVSRFKKMIGELIMSSRNLSQKKLIDRLNPRILGWARYYRTVVSSRTFSKLDGYIFQKLRGWAVYRHPNLTIGPILSKYWGMNRGLGWKFITSDNRHELARLSSVKITRHVKVFQDRTPYDGDFDYWSRLVRFPTITEVSKVLLRKQAYKCAYCGLQILPSDPFELHHKNKNRENNRTSNLEAVHMHCHDVIHAKAGIVVDQENEEPDEGKLSRPVLKERGGQ